MMSNEAWRDEQEEALQRAGFNRWSARSWRRAHKLGTAWATIDDGDRSVGITVHLDGPRCVLRLFGPTAPEAIEQAAKELQMAGERRLELSCWLADGSEEDVDA